jgi:hypothetical protein
MGYAGAQFVPSIGYKQGLVLCEPRCQGEEKLLTIEVACELREYS